MTAGMGFSTTLGVVRHWIDYIIQQGFLPWPRPFALALSCHDGDVVFVIIPCIQYVFRE